MNNLRLFDKAWIVESGAGPDDLVTSHYSLKQVELREGSRLVGKTVRESQIRELTQGLLVGIERNGERILNPEASVIFEQGDHLWIVGDALSIRSLGLEAT